MRDFKCNCPFHDGDNTPSLFILLQDRGELKKGFAHCFGCGWSGNYKKVEEKLGYKLPLNLPIEPQEEELVTTTQIKLTTVRTKIRGELEDYKSNIPYKFSRYLKNRGIGEVVQHYNRVYEGRTLHMPFFNDRGLYQGDIERSTDGGKFYRVNGNLTQPIGIEEIEQSDFVYVTEGQIDKMSLEEGGVKAIALGTVSNYKLLRHIKNLNIVFAYDNDKAGKEGIEKSVEFLHSIGRFPNLYILQLPDGIKDVNELLVKFLSESQQLSVYNKYIKEFTILYRSTI